MESDSHIYNEIFRQYMTCPVQTLAMDTISNEILNSRFLWETHDTQGRVTEHKELPPASSQLLQWRLIVRDVIESLQIWGYCLYRVSTGNAAQSATNSALDCPEKAGEEDKDHAMPKVEILSGLKYKLSWSTREKKWCAINIATGTNMNSRAKHKWKLIVMSPPHRVGDDNKLVLSSACAKSYSDSKAFHTLFTNIYQRDEFNTNSNIFINLQRDIRSVGGNKPWFTPAEMHGSMQGVPGVTHLDFDTLVNDRVDTISKLNELSEQARRDTFKLYRPTHRVGGALTRPPERPPQEHNEHFVTDGFDFTECGYRRAPEQVIEVMDRLLNQMLFSWQVPPQVLGKNINSERLASSNRLSEMAIGRYDSFIKSLRLYITVVIKDVSQIIAGDKNMQTWVSLEPCVSIHTLKTLQPYLKPQKLVELFSCVYNIPEEAFEVDNLVQHQEILITNGKPQTRDKPKMEESVKEAKMLEKAQKPIEETEKKET